MVEPKLAAAPDTLWRVGRGTSPLHFSEISPEDASTSRGGNRFDVPGGRVLYAATRPEGAFAETLARFRPTPAMRALPWEEDEHLMAPGAIPADWRTRRVLTHFGLTNALPFLDVDAPETHTHLTEAMAQILEAMGVRELDVAAIRGTDRFLTRAIALFAYVQSDDEGFASYAGIRYGSRLGGWECWAIFDGTEYERVESIAISKTDTALLSIAHTFDLTIH